MLLVVVIFLGSLGILDVAGAECHLPPNSWCSSYKTAKDCQVLRQCTEWMEEERHLWKLGTEPVNIELYYEYLCPFCVQFITEQLWPTWNKLGPIMNITLVPYGNAREEFEKKTGWEFTCQHGEQECVGNMYETCAIHLLKDFKKYFPFIYCMEENHQTQSMDDLLQKCSTQWNVNLPALKKCYNSDLGPQLEHEMALRTPKNHKYVPWIVLNGVHNEEIQQKAATNLLSLVCDTYKGTKPAACNRTYLRTMK